MSLLEAKSISVRRGAATVLEDVSLSLERSELLIVLGPNGAGKSTLARVLLGLERPASGEIMRAHKLSFGYVPQAMRRDPTLPLSTAGFLKLASQSQPSETETLCAALGIEKLLSRPIAKLSGGELRRAALARALIQDADILVLDEPLAGVDAASQEPIYELIAAYAKRTGAGIVLIAHEILTAIRLAERILCLDIKPLALGAPAQVIESPAFVRLFGPAMATAATSLLTGRQPNPAPRIAADG